MVHWWVLVHSNPKIIRSEILFKKKNRNDKNIKHYFEKERIKKQNIVLRKREIKKLERKHTKNTKQKKKTER